MKSATLKRLAALEYRKSPAKLKMGIYSNKKAKRLEKQGYIVVQITVRPKDCSASAVEITESLREHKDIEPKTNTIHERRNKYAM